MMWNFEDLMMWILGATIAGLFAWVLYIFIFDDSKEVFMRQCLKDHKEYECTAMWRAGRSHFVPMPLIIPMRR